ncbi:Cytochrome c-555 (modular protein) [Candidatus Accumulibacter aalborgensis]|uniref:Cytochrome c-555 (Modular protein) n=1 Tax=Candidatus Accumulibacter aalborgensis TaxID=1860102 RepID=A0A1A8XWN5_9PROT|nr:c-type cytochrome [Candidatus Accumulibacter aalborgensis]SBT09400.1 Cytochrome c-555 (modular protein) [Candidatus Accumulibacter aalborgensis]
MNTSKLRASAAIAASATAMLIPSANAQQAEHTGKEVVDTVCAACHAKGENGAPRIGDNQAWTKRASQGLTALTAHALKGIRNMPAHGGNAGLSDIEIQRAITYMVNQSGGHWVEPLAGSAPATVRSSEQIVQTQCAKCHKDGSDGAPRIGDRAAWIPRMNKGLDTLVKSAVHGHGPMPARGGVADLSDLEIQGAIVYMFNYGVVAVQTPPLPTAAPANPYRKVVDGTDIYLGIVGAEAMSAGQRQGDVPRGKGYYHVNISLFDAETRAAITDAQVKLTVADPIGADTKTLDAISANNTVSYGGYFRMSGQNPYRITAQIQRPGSATVTKAESTTKHARQQGYGLAKRS